MPSFREMFSRLLSAQGRGRPAQTVEMFGWLILVEGSVILFAPELVASILRTPALLPQAADYLRLVGVLVCGVGMLYVVSGRLNAEGFVFASLLDRPLVPVIMGILWAMDFIPGSLALVFAIQDFGSFLWTMSAWRAEQSARVATAPADRSPPLTKERAHPGHPWRVSVGRATGQSSGIAFVFGQYRTYQVAVAAIAAATGLEFGELVRADALRPQPTLEAATGRPSVIPLDKLENMVL